MARTIKIQVKLFASLVKYLPENVDKDAWVVDAEEHVILNDFLKKLNIPMDKVKLIFHNGVHATGNEILKDKDRIGLFPPIAGG